MTTTWSSYQSGHDVHGLALARLEARIDRARARLGIDHAVALVEQRVERRVVHAPPVRAGRRNERAVQEAAKDVRLRHLGELQDRQVEVARVQPRDHRPELERNHVDVEPRVGELLRDDARDVAAKALGRSEQA